MSDYKQAIQDVHNILADYYDEIHAKNPIDAKRNLSKHMVELRKRIDGLQS